MIVHKCHLQMQKENFSTDILTGVILFFMIMIDLDYLLWPQFDKLPFLKRPEILVHKMQNNTLALYKFHSYEF